MTSRLIGIGAILVGLAFGWFFIWLPLEAARAHAPTVEYSIKSFLVVPLVITAGLALLIGGDRVLAAFSGPPKGREEVTISIVVFAIGVIASGLGWWWFDGQMITLGYGNP